MSGGRTGRGVTEANWRPAIWSTVATALIAVAGTLGLAVVTDAVWPALLGAIAGAALAATVTAVGTTDRRFAIIAGGLLATGTGLAMLGSVGVAVLMQVAWPPIPPIEVLAIVPFALAVAGILTGFGVLAAGRDLTPKTDAWTTARRLLAVVPVLAAAVVLERSQDTIVTAADSFQDLLAQVLAPEQPTLGIEAAIPRIGEFGGLLFGATFIMYLAVARVPFVELTRESAQPIAATVRHGLRRMLGAVMVVAVLVGLTTLLMVGDTPVVEPTELPPELADILITVSYAPVLRRLLIAGILVGAGSMLTLRAIKLAASRHARPSYIPVASLAVGCLVTVAVVITHDVVAATAIERAESEAGRDALYRLLDEFGSFALVSGVVIGSLITAVVATVAMSVSHAIRFIGADAGTQFASTGVFLATVAAGVSGASVLVVCLGIATSLLVWDLGEFAGTLGREIGREGTSRRAEIVHGVGAVGLAVVAVGLGLGTLVAIEYLPGLATSQTTVAVLAASVGTLLLVLSSR